MAKDDTMVMELRLRLDKAEKDLSKFVKKAESSQVKLQGIDHRKFTQPLGKITGSVSEFQKSLEASNARVIAFTASAGILMGVTKAFQEMARATIDVEKQLKDINVIMGATSQNLKKFGGELFNVAKETGQSFEEVATAATEFARQGLTMEKTLIRTRDALILTRLSGMDATSAVNALTAAINSFSQTAITSTEIINRMANVDAAFAVSTNDLAEAIRRVGASAEDVKVDFNELIAVVTSVQQTTARGGNVIGNSLKTIFTRIQRTEVVTQLQQLGVAVRDAEGQMRPAMTVLGEFAKVYENLNPRIKAQTAELVGGVYQMNILKSILKDLKNDYSTYGSALDIANNSTDEAIKRNQELNKTLSALINETVQNLTGLGAEVGNITLAPMFKRILEGFNSLSKEVNIFGDIGSFLGFDEEDASKFGGDLAGNIMKSIGNFISGPGFVAFGTIVAKLFLDFSKFLTKSVADFANLNKNASQQAALQQQIHSALEANPQLIEQINRGELKRVEAERKILDALKQEIQLREQISKLASGSGSRAQAQGFGADIDKGSGTTKLTYKKYAGFVPNFSDMEEFLGAYSAGYKPGDIKEMYLKDVGRVKYNTNEQVKQFPGMEQQAIMPPQMSDAGVAYKESFKNKHGFDPYTASGGFIPNLLNVVTSMRTIFDKKGKGSTGSMKDMLSASREDLIKSQGVPPWLQGVLGSALRPGEMVRIKTMGQLSGITEAERAPFARGRGKNAHLKGSQMEAALAKREGNFSWRQRFAAPGGKGRLAKMPVDLGTKSKTGRNYPIESKPELKTKQIGSLFLKTLYENNSTSLKQLRSRLKQKADAGDTVAGAHLDKLQSVLGEQTLRRGGEISKYSAGRVNSLENFNAEVGFDSKNAIQALREKQRGMDVFNRGFIPNLAPAGRYGHRGILKSDQKGVAAIGTGGKVGTAATVGMNLRTSSPAQMLVAQNISGMKEKPETYVMRGDALGRRIMEGSKGNTQALQKIMAGTGMKIGTKDLKNLTQKLSKSNIAVSFGVSGVKDIEKQSGIRGQISDQLTQAYSNIILNTSAMLTKGTKIKSLNKGAVKTRAKRYVGDTISSSLEGDIFEDAITTSIGQSSAWLNKDTNDYRRWDYKSADAPNLQKIFDESFTGVSDAKRSYNPHSIESMATKILFGTPEGQSSLRTLLQANLRGSHQGMATMGRQGKGGVGLMAEGFIPDRSALKQAMETERAMGGDPIIDFDPQLGYFVRDKNTQKNISDVKRDHPEGWANAFRNSEDMQARLGGGQGYKGKVGYNGVVPNFATGMDMAMITGGLGFLAMGINDNVKSFKEVTKAAEALQAELGETEKAEKDANAARKESLEARKKLGKESREAGEKADKSEKRVSRVQDKEARRLVGVDDKGVDKYAGRRTKTGLVDTKGMSKDEKDTYKKELEKVNKRLVSSKKKVLNSLTAEEKIARAGIEASRKKAQKDRELANQKQQEHQASKDLTSKTRESAQASRRNAAAKRAEAAAHNKNAAMTGGQVVKGKGVAGASAGGRMMNMGQGMGMGAMMAMPMVGGLARTVAGDSEKAQGVIGGLESAGSFAMMGAMTGNPYIAAAAAAGGALIGIMQAMGPYKDPLAQLKKTAEEAKEKLTKFQNASQTYLGAYEKLEEGMKSGTIKPEELVKRQGGLEEALMDMPQSVREQFAHVKKDAKSIKQFFDETAKTLSNESRVAEGAAHYQEKIYGGERSWWQDMGRGAARKMGWSQENLKGTFLEDYAVQKGDDIFQGAAGKKALIDYTQMIGREVDKDQIKGDKGAKNIAELQKLVGSIGDDMDSAELENFVDQLEKFGVPPEYIDTFRKTAENTKSGAKAAEALGKSITSMRQSMLDAQEATRVIALNKAIDDKYNAEMKKIRDSTKLVITKLNMEISIEKKRIDFFNKLKTAKDDFGLDWARSNAQSAFDNAKPFMGKVETSRMGTELKILKLNSDLIKNQRKAIKDAIDKSFGITQKQLIDAVKKVETTMAKAPTSQTTRSIENNTQRNMALTEALLPIMTKHLEQIKNKPTAAKDMTPILEEMESALRQGGAMNPKEMAEVIGLELQDTQEGLTQKIALLIDENQMQRTILLDQQRLQEKGIVLQERIASFGGPMGGQSVGRFGAPANQQGLTDKVMDSMLRSYFPAGPKVNVGRLGIEQEPMIGGMSAIDAGRGATGLLDHLINNMNLRTPVDPDTGRGGERLGPEAFGDLAGMAMIGRTATIMQEIDEAEKKLKQMGVKEGSGAFKALDTAREGAEDTAAAQLAKQMKFDIMPDQMMEMNQGIKVLQELIAGQGDELFQNNKMAFIAAIKATELDKVADHFNTDIVALNNSQTKNNASNATMLGNVSKIGLNNVRDATNQVAHNQKNLDKTIVGSGKNVSKTVHTGNKGVTRTISGNSKKVQQGLNNGIKANKTLQENTDKNNVKNTNNLSKNVHGGFGEVVKSSGTNFQNLATDTVNSSKKLGQGLRNSLGETQKQTASNVYQGTVATVNSGNAIVAAILSLRKNMEAENLANQKKDFLKNNASQLVQLVRKRDALSKLEALEASGQGHVTAAGDLGVQRGGHTKALRKLMGSNYGGGNEGPVQFRELLKRAGTPLMTDDEAYAEAVHLVNTEGAMATFREDMGKGMNIRETQALTAAGANSKVGPQTQANLTRSMGWAHTMSEGWKSRDIVGKGRGGDGVQLRDFLAYIATVTGKKKQVGDSWQIDREGMSKMSPQEMQKLYVHRLEGMTNKPGSFWGMDSLTKEAQGEHMEGGILGHYSGEKYSGADMRRAMGEFFGFNSGSILMQQKLNRHGRPTGKAGYAVNGQGPIAAKDGYVDWAAGGQGDGGSLVPNYGDLVRDAKERNKDLIQLIAKSEAETVRELKSELSPGSAGRIYQTGTKEELWTQYLGAISDSDLLALMTAVRNAKAEGKDYAKIFDDWEKQREKYENIKSDLKKVKNTDIATARGTMGSLARFVFTGGRGKGYDKNYDENVQAVQDKNRSRVKGNLPLLTPQDIIYGPSSFFGGQAGKGYQTGGGKDPMAVAGVGRDTLNVSRRSNQAGAHHMEADMIRRIRLRNQQNLINFTSRSMKGINFDDKTYLGKSAGRLGLQSDFMRKGVDGRKFADDKILKANVSKVDTELSGLKTLSQRVTDFQEGRDDGSMLYGESSDMITSRFGEKALEWDAKTLKDNIILAEKDLGVFKHTLNRISDFSTMGVNMQKRIEELKKLEALELDEKTLQERREMLLADYVANKKSDLATKIKDLERETLLQSRDTTLYEDERTAKRRSLTKSKMRAKDGSYDFWEDSIADIAQSWKYSADMMERDAEDALFNVSQQFRSETASAFSALIDGTKDAKEAFGDLFKGIGDMIQKKLVEMAVQRYIFNPIASMGGAKGGLVGSGKIQGYALGGLAGFGVSSVASSPLLGMAYVNKDLLGLGGSAIGTGGGYIKGGSGTKDDVPAMLQKGEYVIRKSSVQKYGLGFMNSVNAGGQDGARYLNQAASQGKDNMDPQAQMDSLLDHQITAKGAMAKFNLRNAFVYDSEKPTMGGSHYAIDPRLTRMALTDQDNTRNQVRTDKVQNLLDYQVERANEMEAWKKEVDEFNRRKKKKMRNTILMALGMTALGTMFPGPSGRTPFGTTSNKFGRGTASFFGGGSGGSGVPGGGGQGPQWSHGTRDARGGYKRDTVPSMLMGGEYVVNAGAVRNYGVDFFHALNSGRLRKYADGGYVDSAGTPAPARSGDIASNSGATNNISITVNVDHKGGISTSSSGMDREEGRNLANMIKHEVVNTIVNQKRQGGILYAGNISGT